MIRVVRSSSRFLFVSGLALFLSACGSSSSPTQPTPQPTPSPAPAPTPAPTPSPSPSPSGQTVMIGSGASTQGTGAFGMNPLNIASGTTVTWRNDDNVAHTATANASGGFNTGTIGPNGGTASVMFATAGTFPYHCQIHPGMMGTIVVQ